MVGSERLITKIYFPRLAVPFAAVGGGGGRLPGRLQPAGRGARRVRGGRLPDRPGLAAAAGPGGRRPDRADGAGLGTLLAALNVAYRDFRYVDPVPHPALDVRHADDLHAADRRRGGGWSRLLMRGEPDGRA